jgi:hypothetical protein
MTMLEPRTVARPTKLADGSVSGQRIQSAAVRALDAYSLITRRANALTAEMDEVTATNGVPVTDLSEEDSVVTTIAAVRATVQK